MLAGRFLVAFVWKTAGKVRWLAFVVTGKQRTVVLVSTTLSIRKMPLHACVLSLRRWLICQYGSRETIAPTYMIPKTFRARKAALVQDGLRSSPHQEHGG